MPGIVDNFKLGDLVYGLQNKRNNIISMLNLIYPEYSGMWTIDVVNKKIILPTIENKNLTLNNADDLSCLKDFSLTFFNYLLEQQGTEQFREVMCRTQENDGEDNYLTRYTCQKAINYVLSDHNKEATKIHFMLDGINIEQALQELDQPRSSFTSSEIREIARNIENSEIANKILFYRNNQQLDFLTVKEEFNDVMVRLNITSRALHNSPIKSIAAKDSASKKERSKKSTVVNKREPSLMGRGRALFQQSSLLTSLLPMDGCIEPARLFALSSSVVVNSLEHFFCSRLDSWFLNSADLSYSSTELFSIFSDANIEQVFRDIGQSIVNREKIRGSLMGMMKQFVKQKALSDYKITLQEGPTMPWVQFLATYLSNYETAEKFSLYITDQLFTDKNEYILLIRSLFNPGETSSSSSSSSAIIDVEDQLKKFCVNVEKICKLVFCVPDPLVQPPILFFPKTPPLSSAQQGVDIQHGQKANLNIEEKESSLFAL